MDEVNVSRTLNGIDDRQRDQIRDLLRSREWELERGKRHLRLRHVPTGEYLIIGRSSDWRAHRNFAKQVRRIEERHASGTNSNE